MEICNSCKCEVPINAKFCPECGTARPANTEKTDGFAGVQSHVHGEDGFGQAQHGFQSQASSHEQQGNLGCGQSHGQTGHYPCGEVKPAKDKRASEAIVDARFIFTNAIVFLVLFSITIFFSIARLGNIIHRNLNWVTFVFYLIFFGSMHIASLVLLVVFGGRARKQDIPLAQQKRTATGLYVASLTALIFGSVFGFCDFISLMIRIGSEAFLLQFFWVIPLHVVSLVFSIQNLRRASAYKKTVRLVSDGNNN